FCFTISTESIPFARRRTIFLTFFFQRPRPHRYLHSFPTRRSSDLETARRRLTLGPSFNRWSSARFSSRDHRTAWDSRPASACWPDRKSTRLNSSHVSISYAVFCLKKKKKKKNII